MKEPIQGKARYSLIPVTALGFVAQCFTYGSKYDTPGDPVPGWAKVQDDGVYIDALFRHLEAWRGGEWAAPDSKLPHLAHLATNAIILLTRGIVRPPLKKV